MAYLASIHRPSSVRHAIKLKFFDENEDCLVVAKSNRLEVYLQSPEDELVQKYSGSIYGKVTMLEKIRPESSPRDHIFVGTDRYSFFTLSWDIEKNCIRTEKSWIDLSEKSGRDSQSADRCLIDPSHRYMTMELFEGILTTMPIIHYPPKQGKKKDLGEIGSLGEPISTRIPELFIRSYAYLYPRSHHPEKEQPQLALLYEDTQRRLRLKIRKLSTNGHPAAPAKLDFDNASELSRELELGATHLIPLPAPAFGVLILSETSIMHIDEENLNHVTQEALDEATLWTTWAKVDDTRWLLGDDYGRLYFLMIQTKNDEVSWKLDPIGTTARASTLVYLDGGNVFVGSHQGDSQLIRIVGPGSIEVLQTFPNIAPVLDFTIMDMGSRAGEGQTNEFASGQARIVSGSGAFQDGSLRSIRSGVGLEDLGTLPDMEHVTDLFALSSSGTEELDLLIVSFVDESRIFQFSPDGEISELNDLAGFALNTSTILASTLPSSRAIQVTGSAVRIGEFGSTMVLASWTPPNSRSIVAASANNRYIALSIAGTELVILDLASDLREVVRKSFGSETQISCISVPDAVPGICLVGFWQSTTVTIYSVETLSQIQSAKVSQDSAAVPRSLLLTQLLPNSPPTLFVAVADGNVVHFNLDLSTLELSGRKSIILGTQQASLRALPRGDGCFNVFATCDHPSLIYGAEGRLVYSAITAEKVTCISPFNSAAYPAAVVLATSSELQISLVDTERTTHVQTLHVGETVRRIAYSAKLKAFGLGTIYRELREGVEMVQSRFKLVDEIAFKELCTFSLNEEELVESVIRADLREDSGELIERFVVGTAYLDNQNGDAVRGRILVFEVTQDRALKVVTEKAVKGACRTLGTIDGKVVAGLVKTVVILKMENSELVKTASYRTSTAPIDLIVVDNQIAVADIMKSVSIVEYKRGRGGIDDRLTEIARHYQVAWSTAVVCVDEDTFLESDAEGNLTVLHRNVNGVTEDDKRRLEVTSELQLGEMVNRMRQINVPSSETSVVIPRAFMATVEGSIYLFALIHPSRQDLLMRLQQALGSRIDSLGHIPFMKYRAFKNAVREENDPMRFVDGELIEHFLDAPENVQEDVASAVKMDLESLRAMVESLKRLH